MTISQLYIDRARSPTANSSRIISIRLKTSHMNITIIIMIIQLHINTYLLTWK